MLLTICSIRQLPQALALGDSFSRYAPNSTGKPTVLIGLVDDPTQLPAGFVSPYPLLPIQEVLTPTALQALSDRYTPTEFAAACKPLLVMEAFRRFPNENELVYADLNIHFLRSLSPISEHLATNNAVLTPFITDNPGDTYWPDEKYFQNIGLLTSDFMAFRRSEETDRLLSWWDNRIRERAQIDFCEGLCLDQIWLMHVPVLFKNILVVRNPGWHVALWNLHERTLRQEGQTWLTSGPEGTDQPLQFFNLKGLTNPDEGFFPHQNRFHLSERPEVNSLLVGYRQTVANYKHLSVESISPAFGKQPEPIVLRGWRYTMTQSLKSITRFLDRVPIPVIN